MASKRIVTRRPNPVMNPSPKTALTERQIERMTLDEAMQRSYDLLDQVIAEIEESGKEIVAICTLYSGGRGQHGEG